MGPNRKVQGTTWSLMMKLFQTYRRILQVGGAGPVAAPVAVGSSSVAGDPVVHTVYLW